MIHLEITSKLILIQQTMNNNKHISDAFYAGMIIGAAIGVVLMMLVNL